VGRPAPGGVAARHDRPAPGGVAALEGAQTSKVACNSLGSVFEYGSNPHDFNGLISNIEIGARELHATFWGNYWVWVWVRVRGRVWVWV